MRCQMRSGCSLDARLSQALGGYHTLEIFILCRRIKMENRWDKSPKTLSALRSHSDIARPSTPPQPSASDGTTHPVSGICSSWRQSGSCQCEDRTRRFGNGEGESARKTVMLSRDGHVSTAAARRVHAAKTHPCRALRHLKHVPTFVS
jgi:hypothetical protein